MKWIDVVVNAFANNRVTQANDSIVVVVVVVVVIDISLILSCFPNKDFNTKR